MYNFKSDYLEGAHPIIMDALNKTNLQQSLGYSNDEYSKKAHLLLKKALNFADCDIHLLVGGTQTNLLALSSFLRPHHAIIATKDAHIAVHETGAIEACGHKILCVNGDNGKISVQEIKEICMEHVDEHMVLPKVVFISNATECGSVYTYDELVAIRKVCNELNLYLYLDGARLGNALCVNNAIKLSDYPKLCDAFYIGGTKNGALFGEALVIVNDALKSDFRFFIKQKGAMLAKGRLLGIQFCELFKDDLYYKLALHANAMALLLAQGLDDAGVEFSVPCITNQLFVRFDNAELTQIDKEFEYTFIKKITPTVSEIRLVTSWATPQSEVEKFIAFINKLRKSKI